MRSFECQRLAITRLTALYVLAMIVYEYLITFDQEVVLFWRRKPTGATVLFLIVRYLALLTYALAAATYASMSDKVRNVFGLLGCGSCIY